METMAALMGQLATGEGISNTPIPGIRIFKASRNLPRAPLLYDQGVIIVGQGAKQVFFGNMAYEYNTDRYLVLPVPLPAECETKASMDAPFLGLLMDIDPAMLHSIIGAMDAHVDSGVWGTEGRPQGLFLAEADGEFKSTVCRLLVALQSPMETDVLGRGLVRELFFRIMKGENAASLYDLAMKNSNLSRIDKALKQIHEHYPDPMDVGALAGLVNMSVSSFHRAFKEVTASSPIQYIKKTRLHKAKGLLVDQGIRVNEAASLVGYESATQFSREFKRYFGDSPVAFVGRLDTGH